MALAAPIYESSAVTELSGLRTIPNTAGVQLLGGGDLTALVISWMITPSVSGYHYIYELSGTTGSGLGVSHFALELSDSCTSATACVANALVNGQDVQGTLTFGTNSSANGDPGLPTAFYGVRFAPQSATQLPVVISFDSDREPVYGDFYVKAGQGIVDHGGAAWNYGNTLGNISSDSVNFIPRPDTVSVTATVPEPAPYLLFGSGLIILSFVGRFRRKS
jgi:hypothetical protein